MQEQSSELNGNVLILSKKVDMKFRPQQFSRFQENGRQNSSGFKKYIKSILPFKKSQINSALSISNISGSRYSLNSLQSTPSQSSYDQMRSYSLPSSLIFHQQLSPEHFLIGNQYQIDIIRIFGITNAKYVETQYCFSLSYKRKIKMIAIETKKLNTLAVLTTNLLYIYKYNNKNIIDSPFKCFKQLKMKTEPKFISLIKNSYLCLFHQKYVEIYIIQQVQVIKKMQLTYNFLTNKSEQFKIFKVPKPIDNIINIFFESPSDNPNTFILWCIEIQFIASDVHAKPIHKIYQIKYQIRTTIDIKNYPNGIYLINGDKQVTALKKNYVIDSISPDIRQKKSALKYLSNNILMHVMNDKIQLHNFKVNTTTKPYSIQIKAKDSIKISQSLQDYNLFTVFPILNNNYIIIYQIDSKFNKSCNGQISYYFFVTCPISRQNKFHLLFQNSKWDIKCSDFLNLCNMAEKMGMTKKQIYFQLWSKSTRNQIEDYQLLLATNDYGTIKQQILKKLRKSSMTYKQVKNLHLQCFNVLSKQILSEQCTDKILIDYLSCHFLLRKLEMFKQHQLYLRDQQQSKQKANQKLTIISITIQQYQNLVQMNISKQFLELVHHFCEQNDKKALINIRYILKHFKFVFRAIYEQILTEVICKNKNKLVQLLTALPQLLPYLAPQKNLEVGVPSRFYDGVWSQITQIQWKQSLYIDSIKDKLSNPDILTELTKSVNFRRNYLSKHDLIMLSKKQIIQQFAKINSSSIYYTFIERLFQYERDQNSIRNIITFLEENHDNFPQQIHDRVFLRYRIYKIFLKNNIVSHNFSYFLSLKSYEIISYSFKQQRQLKGIILNSILPLFLQTCGQKGYQIMHEDIRSYFRSNLSQIADLKYLLNRVNNQKDQFHQRNQKFYQILAQSMQRKMTIGSENDIPLDEVLIYIQNIPRHQTVDSNYYHRQQLERINKQVEILKKAKLNMSVYDTIKNPQKVLDKLIIYFIDKSKIVQEIQSKSDQIFTIAQESIEKVQKISARIYLDQNSYLIFLIYMSKLSQNLIMIKHVHRLFSNQKFMEKHQNINIQQTIVILMVHWKLSNHKVIIQNQQYLSEILTLLPVTNLKRKLIQSQIKLAKQVSTQIKPLLYPIYRDYFTIKQLQQIFEFLPINFVMQMSPEELYENCHSIQQNLYQIQNINNTSSQSQQKFTLTHFVQIHQIYELFILKLIYAKKMKEVLPLIHKIFDIQIKDPTINIIYLILYIQEISNQLNDDHKNTLVQCIFYYFKQPKQLLRIIQQIILEPTTSRQIQREIYKFMENGKQKYYGYDQNLQLFAKQYQLTELKDCEFHRNFMLNIKNCVKHLQRSKQEFKNVKYTQIMAILCNSPYILAKYILCSRINVTAIRCYFSYAIKVQIFDPMVLLEIGRRIFLILLMAENQRISIQSAIEVYSKYAYLDEISAAYTQSQNQDKKSYNMILWKSALNFEKKKNILAIKLKKKGLSGEDLLKESIRLKRNLSDIPNADKQPPIQYPFQNIDQDNYILNQYTIRILPEINISQQQNIPIDQSSIDLSIVLKKQKSNSSVSSPGKSQSSDKSLKKFKIFVNNQRISSCQTTNFANPENIFMKQLQEANNKFQMRQKAEEISEKQFKIQNQNQKGVQDQYYNKSNKLINDSPQKQRKQSALQIELVQQIIRINCKKQLKDESFILQMPEDMKKIWLKQCKDIYTLKQLCRGIYSYPSINIHDKLLLILNLFCKFMPEFQSNISMKNQAYQSLEFIIKAQEMQRKIVKDLPFQNLLSADHLFDNYSVNKKNLYKNIYPKLKKYIDSQNIHNISLYISRLFSDIQLKGQVIWDFLMSMIAKMDTASEQEIQMNLQKIDVILPKVNLQIWLNNIQLFKVTVLSSKLKQKLLKIFCSYLSISTPKQKAIKFLQKLAEIQENEDIRNTLLTIQEVH